jgi:hypothetical protein
MSKILREAIADAKIVRQTAIANAKAILNEAFQPKLKKLINTKLKEELEDEKPEDELEVTEDDELTTDVPVNKEVEPVEEEGEDVTGATPGEEEEVKEGEEDEVVPEVKPEDEVEEDLEPEVPGEKEPEVPGEKEPELEEDEDEDQDEDDKEFNIDEVLKELEDESGIEPSEDDELEEDDELSTDVPGNKEVEPVEKTEECEVKEGEDDDEEVEIVDDKPEVREDEEEKEEEPEKEVYERIIIRQRSAIREQKKVISTYKNQLHEINLLNAKLLYTNKLFNTFPLSNREKMRVVESFDRTCTVREAKLVFASLHEAFASKTITESKMNKIKSTASKVVASTKPSKETQKKLNESLESQESKEMREKFQRLANIKVLKD